MKWAKGKAEGTDGAVTKIGAVVVAYLYLCACGRPQEIKVRDVPAMNAVVAVQVGAQRTGEYVPGLQGERVAVVTNHTGLIDNTHLVDSLIRSGIKVVKVFAPEHGFRGEADAGEQVRSAIDPTTGLPLISLYGENKKPMPEQLKDVDVLLFDIQDVGVRFYTYISTLHYVMEAAAEGDVPVIVLDRPNPNGSYVDGPVLDPKYKSFVGMHPIPVVHGMTVGELALMINGEGWLKNGVRCKVTVVPCANYTHATPYEAPVRPSPNLPNAAAIRLYPALGFFEGTQVSVGRGTPKPFQWIGYPGCPLGRAEFTPKSMPGARKPPYEGRLCRGLDLQEYGSTPSMNDGRLELRWLIGMYAEAPERSAFFNPFFDKLAGGPSLREQVIAGVSETAIRASWATDLDRFKALRSKYLLYP